MTERRRFSTTALENVATTATTTAAGASLSGCASTGGGAWVSLVDAAAGQTLAGFTGFTGIGAGNRRFVGGALQGQGGKLGCLITKEACTGFEIRAEFWADEAANSGIFMRCQDRASVTAGNRDGVNIFDKRPDPSDTFKRGLVALQSAGGTIRFRKVSIKAL